MKQELKQLADISGHKILGNPNSERGNIQEIDMGFGLSFSGGTVSVDLELNDLIDVTTNFPLNPTEADDGKMLFYDHSIGEWTTDDVVTHGTVVINGKKASAGTISKGLPVYLVGFDADLHTVELANATSGSTMPVIGFTAESMNSTDSKHIITFGKLTGIDTTSTVTTLNPNGETWVVNDALYISTTSGGLTKFRPTGGTTQIQRIAKVLRVSSTGGQLFIFNTARTAGLPNLTTNKLWMGNNNGQPIEMSLGDGFTLSSGTISVDANYGNLYIESTGNYSTIRKDISASATALYSSVFGGCMNTSSACYGTILNGRLNYIEGSNYNSILNGNSNTNISSSNSSVSNGTNNIIGTPSQYSTIDNGTNNNMDGCYSVILNGSNNDIETTSQYSIIGSGLSNVSVGSFNVINSGQSNTIDGSSTNISTGRFNTISGSYNNISTGTYNTISGSRNFIGSGSSNTLTGTCMSVLGNSIVATYSNTTYVNKLIINDTPTTNNSNTNLLVRNSSGQIELREASSFSGTNFANSDLTLTASRTHQLNGNSLTISNGVDTTDRVLVLNQFNDVFTSGKGTNLTAQNNLIFGFNTARTLTSGLNNVILGDTAGSSLTTGSRNILLGVSAGENTTTGDDNIFIGWRTGRLNTTGVRNTFVGRESGNGNTTGTNNTTLGFQAMYNNTTGTGNIAIGHISGSIINGGTNNISIGASSNLLNATDTNSIVIGTTTTGLGSNTVVIGNTSITQTRLRGRVEMDTTTDGILLPRLTTSQMDSIVSPATNLLVFNTDLNGLYRYNGSAWVALSAGYGIIEVRDTSGYPTFYADLQAAINATGDIDTIYIYSDIQVTAEISIPNRTSLTIEMNGHRIWYDTSGGDFNLFQFASSGGGGNDRIFTLKGGGTLEQVGTITSAANSSPIHFFLTGAQRQLQIFAGNTLIKAENAFTIFNQANLRLIDGGYWYSTNGTISLNTSTTLVKNASIDIYTGTAQFAGTFDNCHLNTRYGYFWPAGSIINSRITGAILQTGSNIGMIIASGNNVIANNVIENGTGAATWAINCYYAGSSGRIANNTIYSANAGVYLRYGSGHNNYIYSETGNSIRKTSLGAGYVIGNVCITNSTGAEALYTTGGAGIINNHCISLNASNASASFRTDGANEKIFGNTFIVSNASAANVNMVGNCYFANNTLGDVGTGVVGAGTNLMINTTDAFGNIKLG